MRWAEKKPEIEQEITKINIRESISPLIRAILEFLKIAFNVIFQAISETISAMIKVFREFK